MSDTWRGLRSSAQARLAQRDYSGGGAGTPLIAAQLAALDRSLPEARAVWVPGVEIIQRKVFPQHHRGSFSELARENEGVCGKLGFWPKQWAVARMFAGTAKGFHVHPPHVPDGENPEAWFLRLYGEPMAPHSERPYDMEQWDLMFIITGSVEMILVDERAGMERRTMRFLVDAGGANRIDTHGVLIPPGVAHGLRVEGSADVLMVYGTTTTFDPEWEGRIADGVERFGLPPEWEDYLSQGGE